jgi:hypothetical protein
MSFLSRLVLGSSKYRLENLSTLAALAELVVAVIVGLVGTGTGRFPLANFCMQNAIKASASASSVDETCAALGCAAIFYSTTAAIDFSSYFTFFADFSLRLPPWVP